MDNQPDTPHAEPRSDDAVLEAALDESLTDLEPLPPIVPEDEFVQIVKGALDAVGGRLLFKICAGAAGNGEHVAVASVGEGGKRQFLLLTLPARGGALKVETTARSANPVAGIAAAYAGLMDVFQAAA